MSFEPRLEYDEEGDLAYVYLSASEFSARTEHLDDLRLIDFTDTGEVMGVEFIGVRGGVDLSGVPQPETVQRLLEQHGIAVRVPA
jgi:uncharacterized protein YuzE